MAALMAMLHSKCFVLMSCSFFKLLLMIIGSFLTLFKAFFA